MAALLQGHDQSGCHRLLESLSACNESEKCRQLSHCRKNISVCRVPLNLNDMPGCEAKASPRRNHSRAAEKESGFDGKSKTRFNRCERFFASRRHCDNGSALHRIGAWTSRQPNNVRALPRTGETERSCALLEHQTSGKRESRSARGAMKNKRGCFGFSHSKNLVRPEKSILPPLLSTRQRQSDTKRAQ